MPTLEEEKITERLQTYMNSKSYVQVSREYFHKAIGDKDIIVNVEDQYNWPYVSVFSTRSGKIVGKCIPDKAHLADHFYFISKDQNIIPLP